MLQCVKPFEVWIACIAAPGGRRKSVQIEDIGGGMASAVSDLMRFAM